MCASGNMQVSAAREPSCFETQRGSDIAQGSESAFSITPGRTAQAPSGLYRQ